MWHLQTKDARDIFAVAFNQLVSMQLLHICIYDVSSSQVSTGVVHHINCENDLFKVYFLKSFFKLMQLVFLLQWHSYILNVAVMSKNFLEPLNGNVFIII